MAKITINTFSQELLNYAEEFPNNIALDNANQILTVLEKLGSEPKTISPMGDGGVCLVWPLKHFYSGINCSNDGDIYLNYRVRGQKSIVCINPKLEDLQDMLIMLNNNS